MSARSIVVVGTGAVTREQVPTPHRSGLETPLLQINTDAVADRVAGIRRWPAHASSASTRQPLRDHHRRAGFPLVVKDPWTARTCSTATASISPPPCRPRPPYLDADKSRPTDPPTDGAEVLDRTAPRGGHPGGLDRRALGRP